MVNPFPFRTPRLSTIQVIDKIIKDTWAAKIPISVHKVRFWLKIIPLTYQFLTNQA